MKCFLAQPLIHKRFACIGSMVLLVIALAWTRVDRIFTTHAGSVPVEVATVPNTIPVQPSFAYALDSSGDHISAYGIDSVTGGLTQVSVIPSLSMPSAVTVDPLNKFVYVVNAGSGNISAFTIDPSTGALTEVLGSPFGTGASPLSIAVHPSGRFVYVANTGGFSISAYSIDPSTGALNATATVQDVGEPWAVTADPSGRFVYVANFNSSSVSAYTVDAKAGTLTQVGVPFAAGAFPVALTVDPTGKFVYVANFGDRDVSAYSIDATTGALTQISPPVPLGSSPGAFNSITVAPSGRFLYVAAGSVSAFRIDAKTGALSSILGFPASVPASSVAVESSGRFLYTTAFGLISGFEIDRGTGALTQVFQVSVQAGESVTTTKGFLNFPLAGTGPETALISTVFDHSQPKGPYTNDGTVVAYTGESGVCNSSNPLQDFQSVVGKKFPHSGFRNQAGTPFIVTGHYTGGAVGSSSSALTCKGAAAGNLPSATFLFYDGHPGFDYLSGCGTPVYAAASGTVHYPQKRIPGYSKSSLQTFHVLELDLDSPVGYKLYYLHLSNYVTDNCTTATCSCSFASNVVGDNQPVNAGDLIGYSGDAGVLAHPHLHFEVRNNGVAVDPYGWTGSVAPGTDPYTNAVNTRLWNGSN